MMHGPIRISIRVVLGSMYIFKMRLFKSSYFVSRLLITDMVLRLSANWIIIILHEAAVTCLMNVYTHCGLR